MGWFFIIFAALAAGVICGLKVQFSDKTLKRISKLMDGTIIVLIFTMGFRLGNNRELLSHIDEIGILALLVCLFGLGGTMIALHFAIERPDARHREHMTAILAEEAAEAARKGEQQ